MAGGNRNDEAVLRLINVLTALHAAGAEGIASDRLVAVAGWAEAKDGVSALRRDLSKLSEMGWQIDNVAPDGSTARYRVLPGDNRLRVQLTAREQSALLRSALLADRAMLVSKLGLAADAVPPVVEAYAEPSDSLLSSLLAATGRRSIVRFVYDGVDRVVHPGTVHLQNNAWYLRGLEEASDTIKSFRAARIADLVVDAPGTARHVVVPQKLELHPLVWRIDEPTIVVVRTASEYVADVERWLRAPDSVTSAHSTAGDQVDMTYTVTNRAAFRSRLYMLGDRVRLVNRDDFYDELLAELAEMAGE